jgi:hypothetical protein
MNAPGFRFKSANDPTSFVCSPTEGRSCDRSPTGDLADKRCSCCWQLMKLVLMVPWFCGPKPQVRISLALAWSADAGVWAGDNEATVGVVRGSRLALRFVREVLQRLLIQFKFFGFHFVPLPLSTGQHRHTSRMEHTSHIKTCGRLAGTILEPTTFGQDARIRLPETFM